MPLYEYQCESCGARFERIQKFSDPLVSVCPTCGKGPVVKLLSSPAIQFKGSGFYITDYARSGSDKSDKSEKAEKAEKADKAGKGTESEAGKSSGEKPSGDKSDKSEKADAPKSDTGSSSTPAPAAPAKPGSSSKP